MRHAIPTTLCPDRDTWSGFYAGKVAPDVLPTLVEHLDHCSTCQGVVHALAGETADEADVLVASLRAASQPADVYEGESECRRAVERVWSLVPGTAALPRAAAAPLPERLGEYRILQLIGRGGMGAVYRAAHVRLGREVALKVVPPERARDAASARFQREMIAHGKLDHPNVVRATDAGEANGVAFLVMDLVDGIDLDRLVRARGPLPVADACELARQAATGLHHLTGHGLVHRDVKPSNLMLDRRGEVKVLDLGLAALIDLNAADTAITADGLILGTFDYLAPEQADPGRPVDARADVYGLGCSLYYLLTGTPPYSGSEYPTPRGKILAHAAGPVPRISAARPDVPAALAAVLARMLAKNPDERFPTAAAVAAALRPFCAGADFDRLLKSAGLEPLARSPARHSAEPAAPPATRGPARTRMTGVAVAVLVLLLVGSGLSAAVRFWVRPPEPTPIPVAQGEGTTDSPREALPPAAPDTPPSAPKEFAKRILPVALLGFEERDEGAKGLGAKVGDLLVAKLVAKPEFFLVDRADLKKVFDEQALTLTGAVKPDEAVKVGQLTGAKLLVTGSVFHTETRRYLVAKIIGTETGRVVAAAVDGPLSDDLGVLAGKLADAIDEAVTKQGEKLVPKPVPVVDRVAELNKRLGKGARPSVAVQITEKHTGQPAGAPAQTEIARFARETGFELLGADRADVLITGEEFREVVARAGGLVSVRARIELKATDRKTGRVLAQDRQAAVAVDLSERAAGEAALESAAAELVGRVLPKLVAPDAKK